MYFYLLQDEDLLGPKKDVGTPDSEVDKTTEELKECCAETSTLQNKVNTQVFSHGVYCTTGSG